ncbi:MAG: DUF4349 domain-containing protein [Thermoflexales bacterium]|nr:DUF4349 domain-containing protein [Thermoflexales bacterium]MCX7939283.1 DUF4349 domain-containing protein [Thermoflexales bacterium]MDW8292548.1 DUF4349 domain-containing protein [Anaerolineae bacterium]
MRPLLASVFSSALLLLSACAAPSSAPLPPQAPPEAAFAAPTPVPPDAAVRGFAASPTAPSAERLVIRSADIGIVVTDTLTALAALTRLAEEMGGYVVSSSTYQAGQGALQANIQFRVEARRFDEALSRIRTLAVEVQREAITGQDVTAEYRDLEAQLRNLENTEAQLRRLQSEAATTQDVLAVYRELTTVRGEIDRIKGQMQYLAQSAALSSITVSLTPDELAQPIRVAGWRPEGVARDAVQALIVVLQALATLAIWTVIVIAPVFALLALPILAIAVVMRRWQRRRRATMQQRMQG